MLLLDYCTGQSPATSTTVTPVTPPSMKPTLILWGAFFWLGLTTGVSMAM